MKRIISILLSALLLLSAFSFVVSAAERTFYCSGTVTAVYDSATATLTVNGTGDMPDYSANESTQWMDIRNEVRNVVISSGITSVGDYAFKSFISLENVSLPATVVRIGAHSFEHCISIRSISLPDGVAKIGEYAFSECTSLNEIPLSPILTEIAEGTYNGDSSITTAFAIPESCTVIHDYAFYGVKAPITLSSKTEYIGNFAFAYCGYIKEIAFPDTLTYIGNSAFQNCTNLSKVTFSGSLEHIGYNAFLKTAWINTLAIVPIVGRGVTLSVKADPKTDVLDIPAGTVIISSRTAASFLSIKEVVIHPGVKVICDEAFYDLSNLYSVTVPYTVEEIGTEAFGYRVDSTGNHIKTTGFTVYGHTGSVAEQYAEQNGFLFKGIHESDGAVYATDSSLSEIKYKCTVCGEYYGNESFNQEEHSWGDTRITTADCTSDGLTYKECTDCGMKLVLSVISSTGHKANGVYQVGEYPTCTTEGYIYQLCSLCGRQCKTVTIEKTGHTPDEEYITVNEATCETDGLKVLYCSVCREKIDEEIIPSTGHQYGTKMEIIIKAEYKKPGLKAICCAVCGKISSYEIYEVKYVKGDVNGDNRANSRDVAVFLMQMKNGKLTTEQKERMDFNGDGRVNARDLTELRKYLSGVK